MAELVTHVSQFDDVSKINSKESSSKLEEYFVGTLEKGVEVITKRPLYSYPLHDSFAKYRVVINERYKVSLYCDFILSPGDFKSLLRAHQIWSI